MVLQLNGRVLTGTILDKVNSWELLLSLHLLSWAVIRQGGRRCRFRGFSASYVLDRNWGEIEVGITFMLLLYFVELSVDLLEISNLQFLRAVSVRFAPCCWSVAVADCLIAVGGLLRSCGGGGLLSLGNCYISRCLVQRICCLRIDRGISFQGQLVV